MKIIHPRAGVLAFAVLLFLSAVTRTSASIPALSPELSELAPLSLMPATGIEAKFFDQTGSTERAQLITLPAAESGPGYRVVVPMRGKRNYDVEAKLAIPAALKKGDVVLARFEARALLARQETGEASIGFAVGRAVAPHERSVTYSAAPGPEWTLFQVPFINTVDYAAGEAVVALAFGDLVQTVEIRGVELLNFEKRARFEQLPQPRFTYRGRESDAPWRAAALKRIEELRTAPLSIRVNDAAGTPVAGARVEARLLQSEFIWGSSVDDQMITKDSEDAARYRALIPELFNTVVIENGLKWPTWNSGTARQANVGRALDWIARAGLRHKGHNLVWPGWKFSPRGQKELPGLATALPPLITARITEMMAVTKGRSYGWDVVNEPLHERDYFDNIPELAMADWFKLAHSLDPDAQLFINDYSMLNSALSPGTITRFRELIQRLRRSGAPIHGIGVQGHIGRQPRAPELVLSDLDLLAGEGLPVQITEFDVNTKDEQLQADYTRDFLIACYSHPSLTGFIKWGFWEAKHWKPDAAMFRRDWSEKPNAAVWRELVLGKWNTRLDTTTVADGTVAIRGHLGRYRITVTRDGVTNTRELVLTRTGAECVVAFP